MGVNQIHADGASIRSQVDCRNADAHDLCWMRLVCAERDVFSALLSDREKISPRDRMVARADSGGGICYKGIVFMRRRYDNGTASHHKPL